MPRDKISVTIDSKLLAILDKKVLDKTYRSRSHGLEKALLNELKSLKSKS